MDPTLASLWILRILFLVLIYLFLFAVARALVRDLRAASREPVARARAAGRRRVADRQSRRPGQSFALDVVTTLGRDVNNAIVIDDPFASADHAS